MKYMPVYMYMLEITAILCYSCYGSVGVSCSYCVVEKEIWAKDD